MKGLNNETYIILLLISNLVAIFQLVAAFKWPRIARASFFLLFTWASWTNWNTALNNPQFYLEYGDLTWSSLYQQFIHGWFSHNILPVVGFIATCQGLIAISMLLKDWPFRIGATGAIIFLLAILPFGVGSGFPCTAIMAAALIVLLRRQVNSYLWYNISQRQRQQVISPR